MISSDNASTQSMATDQVLNLFSLSDEEETPKASSSSSASSAENHDSGVPKSMRQAMSELDELWDDSQYKDEYDVQKFIEDNSRK